MLLLFIGEETAEGKSPGQKQTSTVFLQAAHLDEASKRNRTDPFDTSQTFYSDFSFSERRNAHPANIAGFWIFRREKNSLREMRLLLLDFENSRIKRRSMLL